MDTIVLGAGLAGLTAALTLQKRGKRTLLLESRDKVGGLCGSITLDGRRFARATNDFGAGTAALLATLGVELQWRKSCTVVHLKGARIQLPPDAPTLFQLLRWTPDLLRLYRQGKAAADDAMLSQVLAAARSAALCDFLGVLPYGFGVRADQLPLQAVIAENAMGYGFDKAVVPIGGPEAVPEAILRAYQSAGGELALNTTGVVEREGAGYRVRAGDRSWTCEAVVSCAPRWGEWPPSAVRPLPLGFMYLAVENRVPWPKGVHALVRFPADLRSRMHQIEAGQWPDEHPFHAFRSYEPGPEEYGLNVYFFSPPGGDIPPDQRAVLAEQIISALDGLLPGLAGAVRWQALLSPAEWAARTGFDSRAVAYVPPPGFAKPAQRHPETGVWHAGNSVAPDSLHGGQAVLSGHRAALGVLGG